MSEKIQIDFKKIRLKKVKAEMTEKYTLRKYYFYEKVNYVLIDLDWFLTLKQGDFLVSWDELKDLEKRLYLLSRLI